MTQSPSSGKETTPETPAKPNRRARLQDIAHLCDVSLSTASRALAGEKGVRPEIRQKILAAARKAHYGGPVLLPGRKVMLVASQAAMIDWGRHQFTLYVLEGLKAHAQTLGLEIVARQVADAAAVREVLQEARLDADIVGLLFLSIDDEAMLALARDFDKPTVLLNSDDPLMQLSSITPRNRAGVRLATHHLIALGHRRILFLMCAGRNTIAHRYEGWQDALRAQGLPIDPDLVVRVEDWVPELAYQAVIARIRARSLDFTAIFAAADSLAIGAVMGIHHMGFTVPREVSIVGMDDLPQAAFLDPRLTTINIPMREIGSAGLDLLCDCLSGLTPPRRVELACRLIERASTAPPLPPL